MISTRVLTAVDIFTAVALIYLIVACFEQCAVQDSYRIILHALMILGSITQRYRGQ